MLYLSDIKISTSYLVHKIFASAATDFSIPPNPKCNDKIDIFFILPPKIIITLLKIKENKKSSNATFVFIID